MADYVYKLLMTLAWYSFLAWGIEGVRYKLDKETFIDTGFLSGPVRIGKGFGFCLVLTFFPEVRSNPLSVMIGACCIFAVLDCLEGVALTRLFGQSPWDYSSQPYHAGKYVSLQKTLFWAGSSIIALYVLQKHLSIFLQKMPFSIAKIICFVLVLAFLVDFGMNIWTVFYIRKHKDSAKKMDGRFVKMIRFFARRLEKAYPEMKYSMIDRVNLENVEDIKDDFALGCDFYKLVWLFLIGSFAGDVIETIFCYFSMDKIMNRSSVIFGPFSIIWGLGIAVLTLFLLPLANKPDRYLFAAGTVLGGTYEYICSVFTEIVFGAIFWDYSKIPFNIGGRINLLFCFFWGLVGLVWIRYVLPKISKWIEKIPKKIGKPITWLCVILMAADMLFSAAALMRYDQRRNQILPTNRVESFFDEYYGDAKMDRLYPSAKSR